jgi:predicted GIY-YIG superfamily endonuclease
MDRSAVEGSIMKRITKDMVERGGWRYCCVCRQLGPRVKAHWQHEGREYCDAHKPVSTPVTEPRSAQHAH